MQINMTGHNIEIKPALKTYVNEKFNKLNKYCDKINSIHVIFTIEKLNKIAEASVKVAKNEVYAKAVAEDIYAAVDYLIDKLKRQLSKYKEKLSEHRE